jgi:ribosome-binding factor A
MSFHAKRLEMEIKKEVSRIMTQDLADPRIGFATVSRVTLKSDLRSASIHISVLDPAQATPTLAVLNKAKKRIRWLLAQRIKMRRIPDITFFQEESW